MSARTWTTQSTAVEETTRRLSLQDQELHGRQGCLGLHPSLLLDDLYDQFEDESIQSVLDGFDEDSRNEK